MRCRIAAALVSGLPLVLLALPVRHVAAQRPDTVRFALEWEVAEGTHPLADSLGELSGVAVDGAGNAYVSDFSAARIWVLDRRGASRPAIGRKGEGPGEFRAPTGLGLAPDGRLAVRDVSRVSWFARDPATGLLSRFAGSFTGPAFADWRSTRPSVFDGAGRLFYPAFNMVTGFGPQPRTGWYHVFSPAGARVDSIEVPAFPQAPPPFSHVQVDERGGRLLPGLNHVPFAPLPAWDITPRGTLLLGFGDAYELREVDARGRLLRTFRREVRPEPIPSAQRRDSLAALAARLDSVPVPLERVQGLGLGVRERRLPTTFPAFLAAYAGADGRTWVRRWSASPGRSLFDVFEPDGRFRGTIVVPRELAVEPRPVLTLQRIVGVIVDPETGAHGVGSFAAR